MLFQTLVLEGNVIDYGTVCGMWTFYNFGFVFGREIIVFFVRPRTKSDLRCSTADPFDIRGSRFPLFCFWKTVLPDPKTSECQSRFRKKKLFADMGHGIISRDTFWLLLKSVFAWGFELLKWAASEKFIGWTSTVERLRMGKKKKEECIRDREPIW